MPLGRVTVTRRFCRPPAPLKTGRLALLQSSSEHELGEPLGTDSPNAVPLSSPALSSGISFSSLEGLSDSSFKCIDVCSFCCCLWQPVLPVNYLSSLSTLQRSAFEPCPLGQEPSPQPGSSAGGACDSLSFSLTLALPYP